MSSGFEQMLLSKNTGKAGDDDQTTRREAFFYEVQHMPGYFPAPLFLNSSGMPRKSIVDNGL
jgi:hypothetical protein